MTALNSTVMPAGFTCGFRTRTRHALRREPLVDEIGDRGRERLDQVEPARVRQLADRRRDLRVVDRVLEPVVGAALAHLELEVEQEQLPEPLLLLLDAVVAEDVQAHAARGSSPHRLRGGQRLDVLAHVVHAQDRRAALVRRDRRADGDAPSVATRSRPTSFARLLLRERPISTGRPSARSSSSRRTSSKLCAAVFPKPIPGSRQTFRSSIPASTANASRSSRNRFTSETTSS